VLQAKWSERPRGAINPFFGVVTFIFGVVMLLFVAIGWTQFSLLSLVTLSALVLCLGSLGLAIAFAARPALVRRLGLGLGIAGTLLMLPFVIGGLIAIGEDSLPHPERLTALASIGIVCSIYAVVAAVALRQEQQYREHPASVPA
jgi:hypothetical protein